MRTSGTTLSPEERQRRLVKASRDYMHGRISAQELQEIEDQYGVDYAAAAMDIARRSSWSLRDLWSVLVGRRRKVAP
ncbi:MAG: hypothetical protein HY329_05480 [Chloroflexi bacterium]|nr:hypothetical protein [Chloroflexota bacterium]